MLSECSKCPPLTLMHATRRLRQRSTEVTERQPSVQLQHSFVNFAFPSIWRMSSKYSTTQHTFAQLSYKQMSKIWYKNIRTFLRYHNFHAVTFFRFTLYSRSQEKRSWLVSAMTLERQTETRLGWVPDWTRNWTADCAVEAQQIAGSSSSSSSKWQL